MFAPFSITVMLQYKSQFDITGEHWLLKLILWKVQSAEYYFVFTLPAHSFLLSALDINWIIVFCGASVWTCWLRGRSITSTNPI